MTYPFIQAKWYHQGRLKAIRVFVIHDAETPETSQAAEAVARYFSTVTRQASAHFVTDCDSTVQCVHDEDTAFGAAGANADGLHFEQAGYARQTAAEWLDTYGVAQQHQLGALLRAKSVEHGIPLRWLTVAQVADGTTKGLCTHADVTTAFPAQSTGHMDPGPNFPKADALAIWLNEPTPTPTVQEDDMLIIEVTAGSDKGKVFLVAGNTRREQTQPSAGHLSAAGIRYIKADDEAWAQVCAVTTLSH